MSIKPVQVIHIYVQPIQFNGLLNYCKDRLVDQYLIGVTLEFALKLENQHRHLSHRCDY
jgi:hypothetical protein